MASLAKPIPEPEWRRHEDAIKGFYLEQGLPLGKLGQEGCVIQRMAEEHNFVAT